MEPQNRQTEADQLLHDVIAKLAHSAPDGIALESRGSALSFAELDARADAVAHELSALGLGAGDMALVHCAKDADLFVCLLAILKTGAAYVPVAASARPDVVRGVAGAWRPKLIVTGKPLAGAFGERAHGSVVLIEDIVAKSKTRSSHADFVAPADLRGSSISQVIFRPRPDGSCKGVEVSHVEAVRFIRSVASLYGIAAGDRCYQDCSLPIDVAIEEVWAMLCAGATVVLGDGRLKASPQAAADIVSEHGVSILSTVPEILREVRDELPGVKVLVVGGRPCPAEVSAKWALRTNRVVSLKRARDRFPSFSIEQDSGRAWRPRMLYARACENAA